MGESYKGLTIRIGADTTSLQKSLKAATSSIKSTQNQLTRIGRGLKFDSSDITLLKQRMSLLGDQTTSTATKLAQLKEAQRQLASNTNIVEKSGMKDLALQTERAKNEYNEATSACSKFNNQLKDVAKRSGNLELFDKSSITSTMEKLEEAGVDIETFRARYEKLQATLAQKTQTYDVLRKASEYKDLNVEIATTESKVRQLAAEYVNARKQMSALASQDCFDKMASDTTQAAAALERLHEEARILDSALNVDPTNFDLLKLKARNSEEQVTALNNKLDLCNQRLKALDAPELAQMRSEFASSGKSIEQFEAELRQAKERVEELRGALVLAQDAQQSLASSNAKLSSYMQATAQVEQLKAELNEATAAANKAENAFDGAQAANEYRKAQVEAAQLQAEINGINTTALNAKGISAFGSSLRSFSAALSSSITPNIMIMGQSFIDSAEEIDSAYRDMRKTVEGTEEQFEALKQAALETSSQSIISADTILSIEAMGGQMGIACDSLQQFAEVVANLDIATDLDAETAAEELGQLANVIGLTEDDYTRFGDSLVRLGNNMPATESSIMDITTRFGSMGSIVGMTADQMLAWSAAIASAGVNSEAGGSSMARTLSNVNSWISEGGDNLQKFAEISGMTADEIASKWGDDQGGASEVMQKFIEGLGNLDDADAALESLGITGVRDKQMLEALANSTDNLNSALDMSASAWQNGGDAAEEARKKSEGFSGSIAICRNNLQNMGSIVGDALVPYIDKLTEVLQMATEWFSNLSPAMQHAVINFALVAAALGPVGNLLGATLQIFEPIGNTAAKASGKIRAFSQSLGLIKTSAATASAAVEVTATETENVAKSNEKMADGAKKAAAAEQQVATSSKAAAAGEQAAATGAKTASAAMATMKATAIGLGITLAALAVVAVIDKFKEIKQAEEDLRTVTEGLGASIGGFGGAFTSETTEAADSLTSFKDDFSDTISDMKSQIESWKDSWNQFYAQDDKLSEATATIEKYAGNIDELSGNSGEAEANMAKLRAAVDTYNEIMGTSVTITDESSGALSSETDELIANADAWEAKAKAQLYSNQLSDSLENEIKLQENVAKAKEEVADAQERYNKAVESNAPGQTQIAEYQKLEEAKQGLDDATDALHENQQAIEDNKAAINALNSDVYTYVAANDSLCQALSDSGHSAESFSASMVAMNVSAEEMGTLYETYGNKVVDAFAAIDSGASALGISTSDLSTRLADAGISFESLASDGGVAFDKMVSQCGGDVDTLVNMVTAWNELSIDEKTAYIEGDSTAFNEKLAEVEGQEVTPLDVLIEGDKTNYDTAIQSVLLQNQAIEAATVTQTFSGDTVPLDASVSSANAAISSIPGSTLTTITGNSEQGIYQANSMTSSVYQIPITSNTTINGNSTQGVTSANKMTTAVNRVPGYRETTIKANADRNPIFRFLDALNSIPPYKTVTIGTARNAAGGIAIPRHADGGLLGIEPQIATSATLTNAGWVGEAGAEAIIPLTNRRYVKPFAQAVASEFSSLSGGGTSVVYNVSINGATINDDAAMQEATKTYLETIARKAGMNRG